MSNDRFLNALLKKPVDATPVWMMRQAGRYLPEYRATRKKAGDFLTLCKTPELACEVTLQPLDRYELDAAILFSDILTIPDAMGLGLSVNEGVGPKFERTVRTEKEVNNISVPDMEDDLGYVMDAVRLIRSELDGRVPLIGFSGSPWTLATYMIEGGSTKDFRQIKTMMYQQSELLHQLMATITKSVIAYLNAQIAAGVQTVMIFDTWGGVLTTNDYEAFSLQYMRQIVKGLNTGSGDDRVPAILFTKGGGLWLEQIADTGCDAVGLDWSIEIGDARSRIGDKVALQGNMDPAMLRAPDERIRQEVKHILENYGEGSGHVFNLGHGITPDIDPEKVGVYVDAVHEYSKS